MDAACMDVCPRKLGDHVGSLDVADACGAPGQQIVSQWLIQPGFFLEVLQCSVKQIQLGDYKEEKGGWKS